MASCQLGLLCYDHDVLLPANRVPVRELTVIVRRILCVGLFSSMALGACAPRRVALPATGSAPAILLGEFTDDYRGRFSISDTLWFQRPRNRFRIAEWHADEQFLIAQNAPDDPTAPNRWTRIDWTLLENMAPFAWGFCLTAYRAPSRAAARATPAANRVEPKTGCNGFPFTRMQRVVGVVD